MAVRRLFTLYSPSSTSLSGSWVVLLDSPEVEGALGAALADRLSAAGAEAILVQPGEGYHRDGNLVTFDVTRDGDWRTFWQDLARQGTKVAGAVHLLGLARAADDGYFERFPLVDARPEPLP